MMKLEIQTIWIYRIWRQDVMSMRLILSRKVGLNEHTENRSAL